MTSPKLWAVSYIDWFDHELTTEFHRAPDAVVAVRMHSKVASFDLSSKTLEELKVEAFDADCMVHAVEVPHD